MAFKANPLRNSRGFFIRQFREKNRFSSFHWFEFDASLTYTFQPPLSLFQFALTKQATGSSRIRGHPHHHPSIILGIESHSGRHKSASRRYEFSYVAFGILRSAHSLKAYPQRFRRSVFPKAWRENRSRPAEFSAFANYFIMFSKKKPSPLPKKMRGSKG
jgi:hypothetical protein